MLSSSLGGIVAADGLIDQIAEARRFLDAGAGLGAQMQAELAVIAGGEEILAEPRERAETQQAQSRGKTGMKTKRRYTNVAEQRLIASAQTLKAALESALQQHERIARGLP